MKINHFKHLSTIALLLSSTFLYAQEITAKEKVKKAIIYRSGAQVESEVTKIVSAGEQSMVISNLSESLREESIQVRANAGIRVLYFESRSGDINKDGVSATVKVLQDSVTRYQNLIDADRIRKYAVDQEEDLLIKNKEFSSNQYTIVDIEDLADLYKKRLPDLKRESLALERQIQSYEAKKNNFNNRINENAINSNSRQIVIHFVAEADQQAKFEIRYFMEEAGWSPSYDIRAEDIASDIKINLKANVWQNSGKLWDNIVVVLSTGKPANFVQAPTISPWEIRLQEPFAQKGVSADEIRNMPTRSINSLMSADAANVEQSEQGTTVEYLASKSLRIESGRKVKTIGLKEASVASTFQYQVLPKYAAEAYLTAKVSGWEEIISLDGQANIFFEGNFVSKTFLSRAQASDTLLVTLGIDEGVQVKRQKLPVQDKSKSLSGSKRIQHDFEITLKSSKSKVISVEVLDQIPVSTDKDVTVSYTVDNGAIELPTGIISWRFSLGPLETKSLKFGYEIKYPKNKVLSGI